MRKGRILGKIFGIALACLMIGVMLGGSLGTVNSSEAEVAGARQPQKALSASAESTSGLGNTGDITVTLKAGQYEINQVGEYSVIEMEGFGSIINPGEPKLPSKTFLIGLPPGAEVVSVDMVASDYIEIAGKYRIMPAPPIVSGQENENVKWGENEEIYSSGNVYPSSVYEYLGMGQMRKYNFARVGVCPIVYYPASNKLGLYRSITLKIKYEISQVVPSELLSDTVMDDVASKIIINYPKMKSQYEQPAAPSAVSYKYNYVVITSDSLQGAVEPLVTWKTAIGYSVNVVTTSWISSNYSGIDLPEQIRNFLIDKYAEWGIEYVLIVGSHSTIPMRYCYPDPSNHTSSSDYFVDGRTPTDYYYADLTGNWDSDGDGYFGEYEQDNVDFYPEVYVGRIPVDNSAMVTSICQKSVNFEQDGGTWKKKALLLGAIYNYEGELLNGDICPRTDGAALMEECWNDILNGNGYSRERMYEKEGWSPSTYACDYPLTNSNVLNSSYGWPSGYGIVNWGAHGDPTTAWRKVWASDDNDNGIPEASEMDWPVVISSSDASSLDDSKPSIVFSSSCLTAYPEEAYNLGNSLLQQGAVAFVGATRSPRYIAGWQNSHDGGCESSDYGFFYYLLNYNRKCGGALYLSQVWNHDYLSWDDWSFWQNILAFCLYGEPSLGTEPISPLQPDITVNPASFDVTLTPNTTQNYVMQIGNMGNANLTYSISDRETAGPTAPAGAKIPALPTGEIRHREGLIELNPSQPISFPTPPTGGVEIAYDDGVAEDCYYYTYAGGAFAVRFTPPEHPVDLAVARFFLRPEWPDSDHEVFTVWVFDDDGLGGAPGTLLGSSATIFSDWGWCDVDISSLGITITSGDFYIAYQQLTDYPDCEALCADYNGPDARSWIGSEGYWWPVEDTGVGPLDWMIRCVVQAGEGNNPPTTPSNPGPANHATSVSVDADLSWTGGDPDTGDTVTYDVYFGTSASPPPVSNDQIGTTYDSGTLNNNTKYYWKVVATDNHAASTSGPMWDFTTKAAAGDCLWLGESPISGLVMPSNSDSITVTINTTGLTPGDYSAEIVIANNDPDENPKIVPVTLHVSVANNPPQLSNPSVQPTSGTPSTNFYYYVRYYDSDGDSPSARYVYVHGSFCLMSLYSGLASNGVYRYGPKNLAIGSHSYYFYFSDGKGGTARLPISGSYSGPTVSEVNNPPNTPSNPSPANHATGVSITADLSWTGGDPDVGDTVTYDVYFGISASPPLVSNDQVGTTYDPGTLSYNTKYYWKIVATDSHAASTTGPVWYFTTASEAVEATATRAFPPSVEPGANFDVSIAASDYGTFGQVVETLPAGFTYVTSSLPAGQVTITGNVVKFTLLGQTSFTYTVTAPMVKGVYTFSGILKDSYLNEYVVGGDKKITVGPGATATRNLPNTVAPGDNFNVSITASDYGTFGQVVETLPGGFSYVSSSLPAAQVTVVGNVVKFTLMGDTSFTYTVTASIVEDTYTFSGILKDADLNEYVVGGDTEITVGWDPWNYDADGDGEISKSEAIQAVIDYFDGVITKEQAIEVVLLYFG